jgi:hypothetical protein
MKNNHGGSLLIGLPVTMPQKLGVRINFEEPSLAGLQEARFFPGDKARHNGHQVPVLQQFMGHKLRLFPAFLNFARILVKLLHHLAASS